MSHDTTVLPTTTVSQPLTIGLDLGDKSSYFVLLEGEDVLEKGKVPTKRKELSELFTRFADLGADRVVFEVGTYSPWISDLAAEIVPEVIVANPAAIPLITSSQRRKSDERDALLLAQLGRVGKKLLSPVQHRSAKTRRDLGVLKSRDALVRVRTDLINTARGLAKTRGTTLPSCDAAYFVRKVDKTAPPAIKEELRGLLEVIAATDAQITKSDKTVLALCEEYPITGVFREIYGVGPVVALSFALKVEHPERFVSSRDVGAYFGLVPRRSQSGAQDPQLRISKTGDVDMRRLLVTSAHLLIRTSAPDSDLKRFGQRLAERGGKAAKKRAVVAVARKLAVVMLAMWKSGEVYDPLKCSREGDQATA